MKEKKLNVIIEPENSVKLKGFIKKHIDLHKNDEDYKRLTLQAMVNRLVSNAEFEDVV